MSGNLRNVAILEELRSQQESAWHKGSPVPVEALVSNAGSPLTDPQLLELIYAEVMLRENSGESCDSDEYVKRFPRLELPLKKLFAVHQRLADSGGVQSFAATDQPSAALPAGDSLAAHEGVSTFKTEKPSAENRIEGSGTIIASQVESHGAVPVAGLTLGPYRLLEKLGEGGMGAVYKAHHEHLGKTVALKILSQKIVDLPDAVSRFKREMKAVGMLHHPNIVQAHDAGQFHDVHFLAMEYIEGTDLQKLVQNGGPLPVSQACDLIRQSCMALEAAHSKGLIHRDIKPANLLLTNSGQIKLLDLGLALLGDGTGQKTELTGDGQAFGTPDYMSPEQWDDAHSTDARTDLYALGCTLYFLLVGHAPYATDKHRTTASKMKAHVTGPFRISPLVEQTFRAAW